MKKRYLHLKEQSEALKVQIRAQRELLKPLERGRPVVMMSVGAGIGFVGGTICMMLLIFDSGAGRFGGPVNPGGINMALFVPMTLFYGVTLSFLIAGGGWLSLVDQKRAPQVQKIRSLRYRLARLEREKRWVAQSIGINRRIPVRFWPSILLLCTGAVGITVGSAGLGQIGGRQLDAVSLGLIIGGFGVGVSSFIGGGLWLRKQLRKYDILKREQLRRHGLSAASERGRGFLWRME